MNYYVYLLIDPRNNKIFYCGKGKGDRWKSHLGHWSGNGKNNPTENKIRKMQREGFQPKVKFYKRKISQKLQGRIGKPHTLESRKKLSALMSGKNHPMWGKPNHRRTPIIETTTGRHFACQTDAAGILKIKQGDIANCLAGRQKSTKGYQFSYNK